MNVELWEERFKGYSIVDCLISSKTTFIFCLKEDVDLLYESPQEDDDLRTRFLMNKSDENTWWGAELLNLKHPKVGRSLESEERSLMIDFYGQTFFLGSGQHGLEKDIDLDAGVCLSGISCIANSAYVTGSSRTVLKRNGVNDWIKFGKGLKRGSKNKTGDVFDWGFSSVDGFNNNDIYAVGGRGDVWHFDGGKWREIDFPSNVSLNDVCVGDDGNVYIAGIGGAIFVGRNDTWVGIVQDLTSDDFEEIVWYRDRAYACTWMGLFQVENGIVSEVLVEADVKQYSFGHLSSGSGYLLSAGPKEAFLFDGNNWNVMVPDYGDFPSIE